MLAVKHCSCCGESHSRKGQRYCANCHAAYMRLWRPKYGKLTAEQRLKSRARAYANVYQKRGKLVPELCEVCGGKAEKHHPDYGRPLEVKWLCRIHHRELHRVSP
jgi:hypothetical protein